MTDPKQVLAFRPPPSPVSYNKRDLILYALGIGATDMKFVYEGDPEFSALPTFSTVLSFKGDSSDVVPFGSNFEMIPGIDINPAMILHGEQETEILKHPIPLEGQFLNKTIPIGLFDKGSGAVLVQETITVDKNTGEPIFRNVGSTFIRGAGGFGGDRGPSAISLNTPPKRNPDKVHEDKTIESQALIYRLSGDYNPLHAYPAFAQSVGFQRPILHGLCSYGFAARAIIKHWCDNDVQRFKSIRVRFASPVYPGETLVTKMWQESETKIIFEVSVKERNQVVIANAAAVILPATGNSCPVGKENPKVGTSKL
eukprot:TRINITY_DN1200_c0_g1_i1.p1 TRINITY_DN1200_c0_g1~~TRINITY_DN1200_c0_g1_i1.p1  ORF type:complete len:312 (-),score=47.97 TRINITY_DN1200_c0_g1_i1:35-970(-)